MNNLLTQLFPELGWAKFSADERALILHNLDGFGAHGLAAAEYVRARAVQFGYFPQASSGAGWTLLGNLTLPPDSNLGDQRILAVIIHEVLHLRQSLSARLSIQGELLGWQLEHKAYLDATGKCYGEKGRPFAGSKTQWDEICALSADSYADLARAQGLMKQVSPVYRAEKLPLYPLGREMVYVLMRPLRRTV